MITLEKAYSNYQMPDRGGDKGTLHSYIDVYAEYISPRTKSLLEVGVFEGHSLMMWQTYLPKARIVGLDTNVRKCQFDVDVRECNATVGWQIIEALGDETFEVIIDTVLTGCTIRLPRSTCCGLAWKRAGRIGLRTLQARKSLTLLCATWNG